MRREEVELLPSGLITCLINDKEVRVVKISPEELTFRMANIIECIKSVKVSFYIFDEYRYEEVDILDFNLIKEEVEEFYISYKISVKDISYSKNVRIAFRNYTKYVMLKNFGDENEFSEEMTGYPAYKDYDFCKYYEDEKKEWMSKINYEEDFNKEFELAVKVDNFILYKEYINRDINSFKDYYYKSNYIKNEGLFKKDIDRIYIGNEFCHNLFPKEEQLFEMINKSFNEKLEVTLCFTYLREDYIEKNREIIERVYSICKEHNKSIEIIINDLGMLELIKEKSNYFEPILGVLLNKRKKDPRYIYKKGYMENRELISENSLNSSIYNEFLKEKNIERYEYESCGYKIKVAKGNHSMHIPFYVTNVSQYCPLYAVCKNGSRGNQELVKACPKYCNEYVFLYPKHLNMIGRYNSLFALDYNLLKDIKDLKDYLEEGIDRIVLNFI